MRAGIQPFCFVQRIENNAGEGVPDIWLCSRETGRGAWVELKYRPSLPVRGSTPVFTGAYGLRPAQVAWIYNRAVAGASIYALGQCEDTLWLVHGRYARRLESMTAAELSCAAEWIGTARKTEWREMTLSTVLGDECIK